MPIEVVAAVAGDQRYGHRAAQAHEIRQQAGDSVQALVPVGFAASVGAGDALVHNQSL